MKAPIIVKAIINADNHVFSVLATFDDNQSINLFEFYPDELQFNTNEFIGLTRTQAVRLKLTKDVAYLQAS